MSFRPLPVRLLKRGRLGLKRECDPTLDDFEDVLRRPRLGPEREALADLLLGSLSRQPETLTARSRW